MARVGDLIMAVNEVTDTTVMKAEFVKTSRIILLQLKEGKQRGTEAQHSSGSDAHRWGEDDVQRMRDHIKQDKVSEQEDQQYNFEQEAKTRVEDTLMGLATDMRDHRLKSSAPEEVSPETRRSSTRKTENSSARCWWERLDPSPKRCARSHPRGHATIARTRPSRTG